MPVALDQFQRAGKLLADLLVKGDARAAVLVPVGRQYIQFLYDSTHESTGAALETSKLSRRELREAADDIAETLTALVENIEEDVFAKARSEPPPRRADESEPAELAREKFRLVGELFDVGELRRRAWIKKTSKHRLPAGMEWEVNTKIADDDDDPPSGEPVPFGTFLLRTASPRPAYALIEQNTDHPVVVDRQDVEILIDFFERLRDALVAAEGAGASRSEEQT